MSKCLLAIKGLDPRSVLEFWVLGIGKKLVHSVFLTDWVLENHGKLFNAQHSMPNTQYPTLILFCLTGHWKNYGVSDIQYSTQMTQYPIPNTQYFFV